MDDAPQPFGQNHLIVLKFPMRGQDHFALHKRLETQLEPGIYQGMSSGGGEFEIHLSKYATDAHKEEVAYIVTSMAKE